MLEMVMDISALRLKSSLKHISCQLWPSALLAFKCSLEEILFFLNQPYPFLQSSCAVLCLAKPQQQPPGNVARVVQTTLADWDAFAGSPGAVHSTQWGGEDASGWKLEISSSSLFSPEPSNSVVVSA